MSSNHKYILETGAVFLGSFALFYWGKLSFFCNLLSFTFIKVVSCQKKKKTWLVCKLSVVSFR